VCNIASHTQDDGYTALKEKGTMFQNIMVATGPSPWSRNAVNVAIRLAATLNQDLLIAHILEDDPQFQAAEIDLSDPQMHEQIEATGKSILQQAAAQAQQAQVTCRTVSEWGSIPEQIVRIAQTSSCDIIVMGTRHLTGDKRLMTGRICNAVLATAPCPILVVPLLQ
jgi:nucleotide-binding universal stress UspA family protein